MLMMRMTMMMTERRLVGVLFGNGNGGRGKANPTTVMVIRGRSILVVVAGTTCHVNVSFASTTFLLFHDTG